MRRIVLIPNPSITNIRASSAYWLFTDMCAQGAPDFHFFWYVPHRYVEQVKKDNPGKNSTIIGFECGEAALDFLQTDMLFPFEDFKKEFSRFYGTRAVDAVFCQNANIAFRLFRAMCDPRRHEYDPLVFIVEQKFLEEDELSINDALMLNNILGYGVSNTVFLSSLEVETARRYAMRYLSPAMVNRMLDHSVKLPLPVNCARIKEWTQGTKKEDRFTLFFGGRLNKGKNADFILEEYDRLFQAGKPINVVVTTGSSPAAGMIDENRRSFMKFLFDMDREAYLKVAATGHVFISASKTSGFPVAWFEQIYAGLVGIMPERKWVDFMVPFEYPFQYKTRMDLQVAFRRIMGNYEKAQDKMKPIREWIEAEASTHVVIPKYLQFMAKRIDGNKPGWAKDREGTQFAFLKDLLNKMRDREFSLPELIEILKKEGESYRLPTSARAKVYNLYETHLIVEHLGFEDIGTEVPVYRSRVPAAEAAVKGAAQ